MSRTSRLLGLDLLRGIAAFAVAIPHFFLFNGWHSNLAETVSILSVEVFFTLSGFVLAPQILLCMRTRHLADLATFLTRRWMRTVPAFIFAVIVTGSVCGQLYGADTLRYLFYLQNLFAQNNTSDFFSVAWSLSIEEWFYVIFPVVLLVFTSFRPGSPRSRLVALIAIGFILVVTAVRMVAGDQAHWGAAVRRVVVFRIDSIAYGFIFFLLVSSMHRRDEAPPAGAIRVLCGFFAFMLAAAIAFGVATDIALRGSWVSQTAFPFAAAAFGTSAIYFFSMIGGPLSRIPALAPISGLLAKISYSVYLFHLALAQLLYQHLQILPTNLQVGVFVLVLGGFAYVFYSYFESPILAARPNYAPRIAPDFDQFGSAKDPSSKIRLRMRPGQ
jgi:peptidoglycan/LPS O-acetylase OafA/YrhL